MLRILNNLLFCIGRKYVLPWVISVVLARALQTDDMYRGMSSAGNVPTDGDGEVHSFARVAYTRCSTGCERRV